MLLRNTIMFIPKGETEVITIRIFTSDTMDGQGLWNVESNDVLISNELYSEFRSCKSQKEQGSFFSNLLKVSSSQLTP